MPRFERSHPHRPASTIGAAALAVLAVVVPSVILASCGLDYGSAGPSGVCKSPVHAIPSTLRLEVGRAAWVQVRDGAAPSPPGLSQMCGNVRIEPTSQITLLYWRPGEVLITGVTAGQASVGLWIDEKLVTTIPVQVVAPVSAYPIVAVGGQDICFLSETGGLFCSGATGYFPFDTWWPARIPLREPLTQVAEGYYHGCGIAASGTVYCWGQGQFGRNSPVARAVTPSDTPVQFPVGPARSVGVGESSGCALTMLRKVECWGLNYLGQLGVPIETRTDFTVVAVPTPDNMMAIAVGDNYACSLDGDRRAWCWGKSGEGQLGTAQEDQICGIEGYHCLPAPAPVAGGLRFDFIAAARTHTCAIAVDGATWCWGANNHGQLGTGDTVSTREPRRAAVGLSFTALALGLLHSCGLSADGAVYCWGRGTEGQLGDGLLTDISSTPVRVQSSVAFKSVSAGGLNTCAVPVNGPAVCWGDGTFFQLGRGSNQAVAATPTKVSGQP